MITNVFADYIYREGKNLNFKHTDESIGNIVDMVVGYNKTARFKLNEEEWSLSLVDIQDVVHRFAKFKRGMDVDPVGICFHRRGRCARWRIAKQSDRWIYSGAVLYIIHLSN